MDAEFQQLIIEIDRIAGTTKFNGIQLLDGSQATVPIQVGIEEGQLIDVPLAEVTATTLGLDVTDFDLTSLDNATEVLDGIDAAIDTVNSMRGNLGAVQNRLDSSLRSILNVRENLAAAESRIRDVDVAEETADLTRNSIMQQAAISVLSQANAQPQIALTLLQG
jgi:flagellin